MKSPYRLNRKRRKAEQILTRRFARRWAEFMQSMHDAKAFRIAYPDGRVVPFTAFVEWER